MNTNRRFLNYKKYDNFQRDLNDGKISEDSIVFIQDPNKRCIWARGAEYAGSLNPEEFNQFKAIYSAFVQATTNTVNGIDGRVTSLENIIEEDHDGVINKFNEIVNFLNQIPNSNGDPNLKQLLADIASTIPNVSNKADKSEIPTVPTNISAFTNDAGYLVAADIAGKANSADLATVATSGDYNDLTNKPTNVSAFTNDAEYIAKDDLNEIISSELYNNLENITQGNFVTVQQLNDAINTVNKNLNVLQDLLDYKYVLKHNVYEPENSEGQSTPQKIDFTSDSAVYFVITNILFAIGTSVPEPVDNKFTIIDDSCVVKQNNEDNKYTLYLKQS